MRTIALVTVALLLVAAASLVPLGKVTVKMLPFDNKSELQVMVRMAEDAPLEATAGVASALAIVLMILAVLAIAWLLHRNGPLPAEGAIRPRVSYTAARC